MRFTRAAGWVGVTVVIALVSVSTGTAAPVSTTRVDVSTGGVLANAGTDSGGIAISPGGRLVVFASGATNLVAGDTNGMRDVFVRNTRTGITTRTDLGPGGVQANGDSFGPVAISGAGRFVAFESDSSNLVSGSACTPANGLLCLFVHDRKLGTNRVIRRLADPSQVGLSEHGRYVVGTPVKGPLIRVDLHTGKAVRVSCCGLGADFEELSYGGMSADANLITFGLDPGAPPGAPDVLQVYVRNVSRGTTSLISHGPGGAPGNNVSFAGGMSPGGRYVIFASYASNLVAGDTNAHEDVFVRDRRLGTTHRVDLGRGGVQANGDGFAVGISAGGRYRVFASHASNLVAGDTNGAWDIFVRDRHTGKTVRVDLTATGGQANHGIGRVSFGATALTAGARWLAFVSPSTNLHPPNANSLIHTYLRGPLY